MKENNITSKPLILQYIANGRGAIVELKTADANKYMGYPSTYAQCMSNSQYLTDTANMSSLKSAGACAAAVEKLGDDELKKEEANLKMGYPQLGIPPATAAPGGGQPGTVTLQPQTTLSGPGGQPGTVTLQPQTTLSSEKEPECPCAKEQTAQASLPEEKKQVADLVPYQRGTDFVQYAPEVKKQIEKNLKESEVTKKWWLHPDAESIPDESRGRDYSKYLEPELNSFAKKTKKQWEKIDKKELKKDTKKDKVKHEKDAVKDDQSKINKLKKGKPSVKKSVEEHDLKKDQEFDKEDKTKYSKADEGAEAKKGNLPPWLKDKKELDTDSKKEKVEHEKDAVKDDKKQIKNLKKDEKDDKKSEKKDKESK
jgi:hypothetical protein